MALAVLFSLAIGLVLGLLGGGGSILTLPMLVYALDMETKPAIAMSLLVVGVTALAALVTHARAGHVRWRTGLSFGAVSMSLAFVAGSLAHRLPSSWLLAAFTVVMLVTGVAMLRPRRAPQKGTAQKGTVLHNCIVRPPLASDHVLPTQQQCNYAGPSPFAATQQCNYAGPSPFAGRILLLGGGVGMLTGAVGAGGGFLVVPALMLGGLTTPQAIATSLLVIVMNSFGGLAGHLGHVTFDLEVAAVISAAAIAGGVAGGVLSRRLSPAFLRRAFGVLVVGMATWMSLRQISPTTLADALDNRVLTHMAAALAGAAVYALLRSRRLVAGAVSSQPSPRNTQR